MTASVVAFKLVVSDLERSLAFYGELFGFTQATRLDFTGPDVTEVLLNDAGGNRGLVLLWGDALPVPTASPGWVPVALHVDDLAPYYQAILDGGHELVVEPMSLGAVNLLMVADPDGYLVEVTSGDVENLEGIPVGVKIPHPVPHIHDRK